MNKIKKLNKLNNIEIISWWASEMGLLVYF